MTPITQLIKKGQEEFDKIFHYKGEGHWFHTVNVSADPEDVDKITGTTDTAWAVPDSLKSFLLSQQLALLEAVKESLPKKLDECYLEEFAGGFNQAIDAMQSSLEEAVKEVKKI